MKRFVTFLISLFAVTCLSITANATSYSGNGNWKSDQGKSGTYSVLADIVVEGDRINISQIIDFGDKTSTDSFVIRKINEDFYHIYNHENTIRIGQGYCWLLDYNGDKQCHSTAKVKEYNIENTVVLSGASITRTGSKTNMFTRHQLTWTDSLAPINDEN